MIEDEEFIIDNDNDDKDFQEEDRAILIRSHNGN
jgi:hypothetical protein